MNPEHRENPQVALVATTAPPPTAIEMQSADATLSAYLEARARDFRTLGWSDGGLIEVRDGRALIAPHIDTTLRRARAAEHDRDQARGSLTSVRVLADAIARLARYGVYANPGNDAWAVLDFQARQLLAALGPGEPHPDAQPPAGDPPRAPLPPHWANSSSTPQAPAAPVPAPEYLPGHLGKLAQPPTRLKPEPAYRHRPSPGHIAAYKLDHCGSCRDAVFYGWSGRMADRAHARHLATIDVGPLAGQPCGCARCNGPEGSAAPDA